MTRASATGSPGVVVAMRSDRHHLRAAAKRFIRLMDSIAEVI